jgi:hypothetical protein
LEAVECETGAQDEGTTTKEKTTTSGEQQHREWGRIGRKVKIRMDENGAYVQLLMREVRE